MSYFSRKWHNYCLMIFDNWFSSKVKSNLFCNHSNSTKTKIKVSEEMCSVWITSLQKFYMSSILILSISLDKYRPFQRMFVKVMYYYRNEEIIQKTIKTFNGLLNHAPKTPPLSTIYHYLSVIAKKPSI